MRQTGIQMKPSKRKNEFFMRESAFNKAFSLFIFEKKGDENQMDRLFKDALIFTSGIAGGFILLGVAAIKSDTFRTALKMAIEYKIMKSVDAVFYGEEKPDRYYSYRRTRS